MRFIYLFIFINLLSFTIMGIDKLKAINNKYRIPEKTLFAFNIFFASIGIYLGMKIFHHKAQKPFFKWITPVLVIIQIILILFIYKKNFSL